MKRIFSKPILFVVCAAFVLAGAGVESIFKAVHVEAKTVAGSLHQNLVPAAGNTQAMWVFAGNQVPNPVTDESARNRLVDYSAQSGVTDLYVSVYQPTFNSSGRRMYEDAAIAQLNNRAHQKNQKVWAAYGAPDFHTFPCSPASFPIQRMAEVVAFNNSRPPSEKFDGVVLDVEPPEPMAEADFQALLRYYQCVRAFLPPDIKLAVAIRFFWTTPVAYPAVGGTVKPAYRHILDLDLDNVIVMGYRDFAGTNNCAEGDGIICVDQDEINYSTAINKPGQLLVGLETLDPAIAGLLDKETFFEEGQIRLSSVMREVKTHFDDRAGFGGFAIHNYNSAYLSGLEGWESPAVSRVVFYRDFGSNASAPYVTGGALGTTGFSVTRAGDDWGARVNPTFLRLQLTNDTDAVNVPNAAGWVFAAASTLDFAAPYNPALGMNSGKVTWSFNMRQVRDNPAGFGATEYGVAFILGSTSTNAAAEGSGYAVVLGQSGEIDPVRLVRFNNGLRGTMTNLIVSNTAGLTDFGPEYLSVRVTFNPVNNQWELFVRNDGATDFAEPHVGATVSQGTIVDSTFALTNLPLMGAYWQGSTQAQQTSFFDNIAVTVTPALPPTAAGVALGGIVKTAAGRGIPNALVVISGGDLPQPVWTTTNSFGYYRFTNVPAGRSYLVSLRSKRFLRGEMTRIVPVFSDLTDFDLVIETK